MSGEASPGLLVRDKVLSSDSPVFSPAEKGRHFTFILLLRSPSLALSGLLTGTLREVAVFNFVQI